MDQPFTPAAATAAYLATIPPETLRSAVAYTHGAHWVLVIGKLLAIVASLAILRLGILPRIRIAIESKRSRPWLATFVLAVAALFLQSLLLLPWSLFADFWRERSFGLSNETAGGWLVQDAILIVIGAIVGGALFMLLYAIIRETGDRWWIWSSALGAVLIISAVTLTPYVSGAFSQFRPLTPGPVASAARELAAKAGIPDAKILLYDGSKQSDRFTARVTGTAGIARIEISDTVLRPPLDLPAIRAIVAHEIAHYKHHHLILLGCALAALITLGLFIASRAFAAIARRFGPDITGIADPAGIPVLLAISAAFTLMTTPFVNTAMRLVETDADAYGLDLAAEPDGAARALLATTDYRAPDPTIAEEVLFYDHPSIARRLSLAMTWKSDHPASR